MSPEQRAMEDRVWWQSRYGRLSQRVLRLLVDGASGELSRSTVSASLDRLTMAVDSDPEDVRHAVQVLSSSLAHRGLKIKLAHSVSSFSRLSTASGL
ncbi:DUF6042 family protein [Micromonospora sp. U56]|uniref:DUF6042 family protein n=1 Tax=Micromonospora sp. U56 TaxID=2824900 RepID=UPI0021135109|nr:DUF6042 family protein [Micromonospora sp. U56]